MLRFSGGCGPFSKMRLAVYLIVAGAGVLPAQDLMPVSGPGGRVRLFTSDAAILESQDVRKDLPCTVTPNKPVLGFDLKYHSGYEVTVPLKELAGSENQLTMVFRVTPENHPDEPVYFSQHYKVPVIDDDASGPAYLQGTFEVGEGKYHVDWLMRDRAERLCSFYWDIEASLPSKDKQMALDIPATAVQPADKEPFKQEAPVERQQQDAPLNVKVVINFAPQDSASATLQPLDTNALVSILRNIAREPRIGKFSIIAYNMQEQRVIYRQQDASQIDFPALGEGLEFAESGYGGSETAEPEARRFGVPVESHHQGIEGREAGRRDFRGAQGDARRRDLAGHLKQLSDVKLPGVLHELQPEPAGESLAGCHRQHREIPERAGIHDHEARATCFSPGAKSWAV